ncbi:response regulator [Cohnella lupini]|uniref:AraC family two component transcriptional regulator n=1 Tax=Cohnella lupini TaxID=1294267 RepID=A0A3D9IWZ5_9BACL|nr:response regulator [Cohnella lupini]RED66174.1 AraC family two component transcriptional regulator [Cohnella lupini]
MFKLLIVEDEASFREAILTMIDWESEGIRVIGTASNGRKAIEAMEEEKPDILLTDIRMPMMSGLELIEEAKARGIDLIPVLLTGYSEFEYAQKALKLGVFDYILKPCNPKQVKEVIGKVKDELVRERSKANQVDRLERQWTANARMVTEDKLLKWLREAPWNGEERLAEIKEYGIRLEDASSLAIVFRFDSKELNVLAYGDKDLGLIRYAASNIIKESIGYRFEGRHELLTLDDRFVLLANVPNQLDRVELQDSLETVQRNLSSFLKVTVSIGVGSVTALPDLHISYKEALEALTRRFFHGGSGLFVASEQSRESSNQAEASKFRSDFAELEREIRRHIAESNYAEFVSEVEEWLDSFREQELSVSRIHLHTYSLIDSLMKEIGSSPDERIRSCVGQFEACVDQVQKLETFEELSTLITRVIQRFVELMNSKKAVHKTIQYVINLINEKYSTNLTLKSIAEEVFISPSHLSTLFRQEMGINFLDYLHQHRIDKAKQLLKDSGEKVYSVARKVGYYDEAHFVRFFKKWTGLLPSQYKKQNGF